jgi:Domain of unknown function (DUF4333)
MVSGPHDEDPPAGREPAGPPNPGPAIPTNPTGGETKQAPHRPQPPTWDAGRTTPVARGFPGAPPPFGVGPQYPSRAQPGPRRPPPTFTAGPPHGPHGGPAYGAPGFGGPAGPYGSPAQHITYVPMPARRSRKRLWFAGLVVLVLTAAAVAILGFWTPGFFITRELDVAKVQDGVQHILTDPKDGYGISNVANIKCNNGQNPSATDGTTFRCDATIDGAKRQVALKVVDHDGTYQVSLPK